MAITIGRLAVEFLSLRAAKHGTPDSARKSAVEGELRRINAYHKCNCPGVDQRLKSIWQAIDRRDYITAARLSQEWERSS